MQGRRPSEAAHLLLIVLLDASTLIPAPAKAHGALYGLAPFVSEGALTHGGDSAGFTWPDRSWSCALNSGLAPSLWRPLPTGGLLMGTGDGLRLSEDQGCTWTRSETLGGGNILSLAQVQGHLWVSVDGEGAGLWRGEADGTSWTQQLPLAEGRMAWEVMGAGETLWWATWDRQDLSSELWFGDPAAGLSPLEGLDGWRKVSPLGLRGEGEALLASALDSEGQTHLLSLSSEGIEALWLAEGFLGDAAELQGEVLALVDNREIHRVAGGSATFLAEVPPLSCLQAIEGQLWGCGVPPEAPLFLTSPDGIAWSAALWFNEVLPHECPAGTSGANVCPEEHAEYMTLVEASGYGPTPTQSPTASPSPSASQGSAAQTETPGSTGPTGGCEGCLIVLGWPALRRGKRRGSGQPFPAPPRDSG